MAASRSLNREEWEAKKAEARRRAEVRRQTQTRLQAAKSAASEGKQRHRNRDEGSGLLATLLDVFACLMSAAP